MTQLPVDFEALGAALVEQGPQALFDEIENMLPEPAREGIQMFPLLAVGVGVGIGVWLGMKKRDEVLAAGSAVLTAVATAYVGSSAEPVRGSGDE